MDIYVGPSVDDSGVNENMALDTLFHEKGSNIKTLEPFERTFIKRKTKYRPNPTLIHFDSLFGLDSWSRYLILKTSKKILSTKLENILLSVCPTREMSFKLIKPNEWLIEATTKNQSEMFQSLSNLEGIEVNIKKHDTLNSIQGTVVLPSIDDENENPDKYILLDSLKKRYDNVEDVEVYEVPNKKYPGRPLRLAKIKFEGQSLPQKIKIQGQNREVRPYVPKPVQCLSCSKFGHSAKKCRSTPVCAFCSSLDHSTKWNCGTPKCVNCGLEHHARSKECTFYIYNTELKLLVSRTGMSFREAKLELKARGFKDPAKNPLYKSKVRNIVSQNVLEKYNEYVNKQSTNIKSSKKPNISSNENEQVVTENFFGVLSTIDVEIHREDLQSEDSENNQNKINDKEEMNRQHKRPFENLSPVKNSTGNVGRSVKPKIQRNHCDTSRKIQAIEAANSKEEITESTNSEEIAEFSSTGEIIDPSPVYHSKLKIVRKTVVPVHEEKCKCLDCFQSEINKFSELPHGNSCGCHECFVHTCKDVKPLTKDKLINIIKSFIKNRTLNKDDQLDTHPSECMCVNHLLYYKKNKIAVLDKFLSQKNGDHTKSNTNNNNNNSNNNNK